MHHVEINQFDLYLDKSGGCIVDLSKKATIKFDVVACKDNFLYLANLQGGLIPFEVVDSLKFCGINVSPEFIDI